MCVLRTLSGGNLIEKGYYSQGLKEGWVREIYTEDSKEGNNLIAQNSEELVRIGKTLSQVRDLEKEVWLRHDSGTVEEGWTFSGEFKNGCKHGLGILRKNRGKIEIKGNWINDNIDGFCCKKVKVKTQNFRYLYSGDLIGDDLDGNMHGIGRFEDRGSDNLSCAVYLGSFEQGQRNGFGQYRDKDTLYVGGWNHDKKNGLGYQKYSDKSSYFGYWVDNMRQGLGMWLSADGKEVRGEWSDDLLNGRVYIRIKGSDQRVFVMYKNGRQMEHIQYGRNEFLAEFEVLDSQKYFSVVKNKVKELQEYVSVNEQDLEEEISRCEVKYDDQSSRLDSDIREMRVKFDNMKINHEKDMAILSNLCRDNGVDINAVKIKQRSHGVLPKDKQGLQFDLDEMKTDLATQRELELQPDEIVVGRGLEEALQMKEQLSTQRREDKDNNGRMVPRFSGQEREYSTDRVFIQIEDNDDQSVELYKTNSERKAEHKQKVPKLWGEKKRGNQKDVMKMENYASRYGEEPAYLQRGKSKGKVTLDQNLPYVKEKKNGRAHV